MSETVTQTEIITGRRRGRWKRRLMWAGIVAVSLLLVAAFVVRNHLRTLLSLRRVAGTNAYIVDYYLDYRIHEIRDRGMDTDHIEDSCLATLLPDIFMPIAARAKHAYIPRRIETVQDAGHHCSTVMLQANSGDVFFGRNFDYSNDACLILRVHDDQGVASIAVIDLAYLNLNRSDLDQTSLIGRFPLLFAPYYVMDGMNRHGVAVSNMAVNMAEPPVDPERPEIINSTLMRLMLDYATSADEAAQIANDFNVKFVQTPVHLMVADSSGRSLIIEYIDGQIKTTPAQQRWQVCTNHNIWQKSELENDDACNRYRTGSEAAERLAGAIDSTSALNVVRSMSVDNWTMWTSVYNLSSGDLRVLYKARLDAEYRDAVGQR